MSSGQMLLFVGFINMSFYKVKIKEGDLSRFSFCEIVLCFDLWLGFGLSFKLFHGLLKNAYSLCTSCFL